MGLAAVAGMGAATCCHPLDVIRVQMQTSGGAYKNTLDAGVQIFKRSGLSQGLYAGISAAYLRQWLYGSCRIGIYSYLLEQAQISNRQAGRNANDISLVTKLSMGCCSGAIGSFVGTPSELALVRMSADSKAPVEQQRNYKNVLDCIVRISKEEGATNLWRGATPTVMRATLLSACQMGVTSEAKLFLANSGYFGPNGEWMNGYPKMFVATLFSSFCANIVANPFDVIKSRLQNMVINADGTSMYRGMADCFVKSVKADGPMVLYAGFTPAFVKLAPYSIISLTLADKLTKALTGKEAL
jgi:solute carrier family 25 oxoglutarate transporter 11